MNNITPINHSSENTPGYEPRRRGDVLLFEVTSKRLDLEHSAALLAMHAARTEDPAVAHDVDVAIDGPQQPAQPAAEAAPVAAHDSEAFANAARQQIVDSLPANQQPSLYLQQHQRQEFAGQPQQPAALPVQPAVSPLFANQAELIPTNLPDDEIDADPLADGLDEMGYKDMNNVAA